MLTYLTTSIFDSPAQALVNPVNTVGVMGKGLALVFKQRYPAMFQEYRTRCQTGVMEIGQLHTYQANDKISVNIPTKKHWRNPAKREFVEAGLQAFVESYEAHGISSVSFPQLGTGLGGLNWESQVKPLMEQYLTDLPIPVYIHLYAK
jgi:O-acetyl-ADP-ribose deacetylase (regulator of RNase III)